MNKQVNLTDTLESIVNRWAQDGIPTVLDAMEQVRMYPTEVFISAHTVMLDGAYSTADVVDAMRRLAHVRQCMAD